MLLPPLPAQTHPQAAGTATKTTTKKKSRLSTPDAPQRTSVPSCPRGPQEPPTAPPPPLRPRPFRTPRSSTNPFPFLCVVLPASRTMSVSGSRGKETESVWGVAPPGEGWRRRRMGGAANKGGGGPPGGGSGGCTAWSWGAGRRLGEVIHGGLGEERGRGAEGKKLMAMQEGA